MAISRTHVWSAGEVLTAIDLNAEFNNILTNASDLLSPLTKAISMGGFALNFDAANTIALTATTSGIILTGGTIREPGEDTITAFATGGQTNATALSVAKKFHRISTCATTADSYKLPASTAGQCHYVRNDGAAAAQAFGAGTDTINGVATATGIPHAVGLGIWFVCTTAGNWTTGPLVAVSGNFPVTLTATASTGVTLPTTGTLATLAGAEAFSNKTSYNKVAITAPATSATLTLADGTTLTTAGNLSLPAVTAKGDVLAASASGVLSKLAVGTDGNVLMADSSQASGLNYGGRGSIIQFSSSSVTVADGLTVFIGGAFASASEGLVIFSVPFAGTIKNMRTQRDTSAAGTCTYTLRVNGSDTSITSAAIAPSLQSSDTTHSVTVSANSSLSVKLVTSGGADTAGHRVTLEIVKTGT